MDRIKKAQRQLLGGMKFGDIARGFGCSYAKLYQQFRGSAGVSPDEWLRRQTQESAHRQIRDALVPDIAMGEVVDCGGSYKLAERITGGLGD